MHPNIIEQPWAVLSPMRAEGIPPIITVLDPFTIVSGGPTQTHRSPTIEAGKPPINTVGIPGPVIGPPTWGTGPVSMGQTCISVSLAAGGIRISHFMFDTKISYFIVTSPYRVFKEIICFLFMLRMNWPENQGVEKKRWQKWHLKISRAKNLYREDAKTAKEDKKSGLTF